MSKTLERWLDRADVVNVGALIALAIYASLVAAHIYIAIHSADPQTVIKDVLSWAMPVFLSILQTYGLIKKRIE